MEKAMQLRQGIFVIIALAVLTAVEFYVAIGNLLGVMPLLGMIVLAKTALILLYYMHLGKTFEPNAGGH